MTINCWPRNRANGRYPESAHTTMAATMIHTTVRITRNTRADGAASERLSPVVRSRAIKIADNSKLDGKATAMVSPNGA